MPNIDKDKKTKENYDVKKARQIVLDTIGEEEKVEEEGINIKVVPGGFGDKDASKIDSNWGDKKEKPQKTPEKEFITISPEPTQKFIEEKEDDKNTAEKEPTKEEIELKKAQIQEEIKDIEDKPMEAEPKEVGGQSIKKQPVVIAAPIVKKEKISPIKKATAPKTAKEAYRKKTKAKKLTLEIPVKLELKKTAIKKKPKKINIYEFISRTRITNSIYIISYTIVVGVIFYLLFAMAIYNFNPDNIVVRKTSSFFPIPALISNVGMIEYYDYQDYLKFYNYDFDKAKTALIKQIVYKRVLADNPDSSKEKIYEEINKEMGGVKLWSLVD